MIALIKVNLPEFRRHRSKLCFRALGLDPKLKSQLFLSAAILPNQLSRMLSADQRATQQETFPRSFAPLRQTHVFSVATN